MRLIKVSSYSHHRNPKLGCYSVHTFFALGLSCVLPLGYLWLSHIAGSKVRSYAPSGFYGDRPTPFV